MGMLLDVTAGTGAFATLGTAVSQLWSWFFDMATQFFTNPMLLIPLAVFVIGAMIGLVHRVIR